MKVAVFTDSYTPYVSGVVRSIQRFSTGMTRLGHEVFVFAPSYNRAQPEQTVDASGAKIFRFFSLPAPTYPDFSLPIPISPGSDKLLLQMGIDIIHSHSPFLMGQLSATLAWRTGIPLVFTHHTMYHEYVHYIPAPRTITRQMVIRFLQHYCRQCDHLIAPTPKVKDMMESIYRLHVPVTSVPTGVDLEPYEHMDPTFLAKRFQLPEATDIMLFVGRLGKEKNPKIVLDAFKQLANEYPDLHMVFVGDGPERAHLRQQAAELSLEGRVHFTGVLQADEVVSAYASARLFVFGSVTETQGLVTIESMAAGTPVVAVRATGSEDIVEHGVNGFLTENSAEALAEHARILLTQPEQYRSMQTAGRHTANNYSLTSTAQRLIDIYEELLQDPKEPHRLPRILSWGN